MPQNRQRVGLQIPLKKLTLLERIERNRIDDFISNLNFLATLTAVNLIRTKSFLFDLKCTQIAGSLGLLPKHHWGILQRSPDPLAVKGGGDEREERNGEERGGDFEILPNLYLNFLATPLHAILNLVRILRDNY